MSCDTTGRGLVILDGKRSTVLDPVGQSILEINFDLHVVEIGVGVGTKFLQFAEVGSTAVTDFPSGFQFETTTDVITSIRVIELLR